MSNESGIPQDPPKEQSTASLNTRASSAARWSLLTELIARIIAPVTQLVLARILAPEAFGIVATIVMITSFAEMISDAGFQKYLIQREFADDRELDRNANVAFWSSLVFSLVLLLVIVIFREPVASLAGNPGLGFPLAITALSLPLTSIVSTQLALFRRALNFRKILPVRVASSVMTLIVAVPLALLDFNYWALIFGLLSTAVLNSVALSIISDWKPSFYYSFGILKRMFSFSSWSLLEAVSIWMTTWAGTFIVSSILTSYELGLYRQPMTVVNSIFALVTSATTPILFSTLSRLQNDRGQFHRFFMNFQFMVALFILPIGIGTFSFRNFFTNVLLGSQWSEASLMIGAWSLSTGFMIVFSHYYSEIFRALGKPKVSLLSQILYTVVLIPCTYYAALEGFQVLVIVSTSIRLVAILINQAFGFWVAGINPFQTLRTLQAPLISAIAMGLIATWLATVTQDNWLMSTLGIIICALVYLSICFCFPRSRQALVKLIRLARTQ